jgi:hypothetical protein
LKKQGRMMSTDEKKKNIKWTNVMVDKFVRCMVSHAVNNFADNGFSKDVLTNILRDFNEGSCSPIEAGR